ncbi:hypothetical protein Avbf_10978 [Armadillidium vulgare]|nr:hypothetical protein Avbf_10978 [Armadillidium vulgare]
MQNRSTSYEEFLHEPTFCMNFGMNLHFFLPCKEMFWLFCFDTRSHKCSISIEISHFTNMHSHILPACKDAQSKESFIPEKIFSYSTNKI